MAEFFNVIANHLVAALDQFPHDWQHWIEISLSRRGQENDLTHSLLHSKIDIIPNTMPHNRGIKHNIGDYR
jgi:hypothetical protein